MPVYSGDMAGARRRLSRCLVDRLPGCWRALGCHLRVCVGTVWLAYSLVLPTHSGFRPRELLPFTIAVARGRNVGVSFSH